MILPLTPSYPLVDHALFVRRSEFWGLRAIAAVSTFRGRYTTRLPGGSNCSLVEAQPQREAAPLRGEGKDLKDKLKNKRPLLRLRRKIGIVLSTQFPWQFRSTSGSSPKAPLRLKLTHGTSIGPRRFNHGACGCNRSNLRERGQTSRTSGRFPRSPARRRIENAVGH